MVRSQFPISSEFFFHDRYVMRSDLFIQCLLQLKIFFNGKQLLLESTEKGTDRKHNQGFLQERCKNGGGRRQHHRTKTNPRLYNKKDERRRRKLTVKVDRKRKSTMEMWTQIKTTWKGDGAAHKTLAYGNLVNPFIFEVRKVKPKWGCARSRNIALKILLPLTNAASSISQDG